MEADSCSYVDFVLGLARTIALNDFLEGGQSLWSGNLVLVTGNKFSTKLSRLARDIWDRAKWWDRKFGGLSKRGVGVTFGNSILNELRSPSNMG